MVWQWNAQTPLQAPLAPLHFQTALLLLLRALLQMKMMAALWLQLQ
jgi:hypothetical protein